VRSLRDRILCKIWPDLWYKLNTTFTEEEIREIECIAYAHFEAGFTISWKIINSIRLKMNPLRQKFYDKEYADKIKKEWEI